ncbi:MAG: UDP-2,3-diacylglucosamine diphosphatase, partial [Rhodanobacteraceae bacterium]
MTASRVDRAPRSTTLFISDLHLDASRPHITRLFVEFLRDQASQARALYILGDLFEAWVGDDATSDTATCVAEALRDLHGVGVPCFFMHGNRDFLLGDDYARRARLTLLPDPCVIEIQDNRVLLMHGDTLCTDDAAYQAFRARTREPGWQHEFLGRPLDARNAFAREAREQSARYTSEATEAIMDVNAAAVTSALRANDVRRLIHGHTHRPAVHRFDLDGAKAERIVLGDWYEQGSVLRVN